MRMLRDCQTCVCAAVQVHGHGYPPTAQPSLKAVKELWNDWELHLMILVSFGLQVFLMFAAGLRRSSASQVLRSLLWLAYLSADSVAIFVLGRLAVYASEPRHQLLFFWAPFVLLHLGGQHTITAFSMQDNRLWRRHLLGLVSQVAVACYVVSRSSWPHMWLTTAMCITMIVGVCKYFGRTLCLYISNPEKLKDTSDRHVHSSVEQLRRQDWTTKRRGTGWSSGLDEMKARLNQMHKPIGDMRKQMGDMQLRSMYHRFAWQTVLSSTPLSNSVTVECANALPGLLQEFKQTAEGLLMVSREKKNNEDYCPAYNYVGALLCLVYERLYTKAALWHSYRGILITPFLLLVALVSFIVDIMADHHQHYSLADVVVSYILLIGALLLEVASVYMHLSSYTALTHASHGICICLAPIVSRAVRNIQSISRPHRKQWSEMLGQHSRIKKYTRREGVMAYVPEWIADCLYHRTLTHKPICEDLKMLVLNKLLDFGIGDQQYWNFASTRGRLALEKRINLVGSGTPLEKSISDADFTTSLLIWHIATDICYYHGQGDASNTHSKKKDMSQDLSYYIMYLVFHCHVMLTSTAKIMDSQAYYDMDHIFGEDVPSYMWDISNKRMWIYIFGEDVVRSMWDIFRKKKSNLDVKRAIEMVFTNEQDDRRLAANQASSNIQPVNQGVNEAIEIEMASEAEQDSHQAVVDTSSSSSQPVNYMQGLRNTVKTFTSPVLPRACEVARELISIDREDDRWDLIADVWLEMLYYVAPRCGGDFHFHHLSTGGEFITHVLVLMHQLGPFIPPPNDLAS